jgi:hypothetical protein
MEIQKDCQELLGLFKRALAEKAFFDRAMAKISDEMEMNAAKKCQKNIDSYLEKIKDKLIFGKLIKAEMKKLEEFFGYEIPVPGLPKTVDLKRYEEWQNLGFEIHFLPKENMNPNRELPGWIIPPNDTYFEKINNSYELDGKWILIESRDKPDIDIENEGMQEYPNDPFAEKIKDLRAKGILRQHPNPRSRSNISYYDLNKPVIIQAFAEILKADPDSIRLPRAIEWNYLGNAFYPEWGQSETWEYFKEKFEDEAGRMQVLCGGDISDGGLFDVSYIDEDDNLNRSGFRLLIDFE